MIIGAGDIGGALARQLAAIDLVGRIVIVDDLAAVAAGKALDVAQSAPVDRYHTVMAGTADVAAVVGAVVVIVADLAANPVTEWKDEAGLALDQAYCRPQPARADRLRGRVRSRAWSSAASTSWAFRACGCSAPRLKRCARR